MIDVSGCLAKLDRAEYDLNALASEIREHSEVHGERTAVQRNDLDDSFSLIFKERTPIPDVDWGIKLGEVVHNLRSALDHLVAALVVASGHQVNTSHQFPIFDSPNDWDSHVSHPSRGRRSQLQFIGAADIAIIEEVQPYNPTTGLPSLATIRDFSNTDKHRMIHVVQKRTTSQPKLSGSVVVPAMIIEVDYAPPDSLLEDGAEIARFHIDVGFPVDPTNGLGLPSDTKVDVRLDLRVTTLFGKPGQETTRIGDFRQCLSDCRSVVARF